MAPPFAYAMYVAPHAHTTEKQLLRNLLPTHFGFRKTDITSCFGKAQIPTGIRRETVEDGFDMAKSNTRLELTWTRLRLKATAWHVGMEISHG